MLWVPACAGMTSGGGTMLLTAPQPHPRDRPSPLGGEGPSGSRLPPLPLRTQSRLARFIASVIFTVSTLTRVTRPISSITFSL